VSLASRLCQSARGPRKTSHRNRSRSRRAHDRVPRRRDSHRHEIRAETPEHGIGMRGLHLPAPGGSRRARRQVAQSGCGVMLESSARTSWPAATRRSRAPRDRGGTTGARGDDRVTLHPRTSASSQAGPTCAFRSTSMSSGSAARATARGSWHRPERLACCDVERLISLVHQSASAALSVRGGLKPKLAGPGR